jgi:hypothetical protein
MFPFKKKQGRDRNENKRRYLSDLFGDCLLATFFVFFKNSFQLKLSIKLFDQGDLFRFFLTIVILEIPRKNIRFVSDRKPRYMDGWKRWRMVEP